MVESEISIEALEEESNRLATEGKTPMYVAVDKELKGIIAVADTVKESSKKAIEKLHSMGIEVAMLTGDNKRTADAIAKQVGIDVAISEVLPQDKNFKAKVKKWLWLEMELMMHQLLLKQTSGLPLDQELM